ncbi:MAG TPA: exonuclease SbcCD subunit D [Mycobacteriales bacterium]|nr:exonuclease SbcCD subunit D [Mycobacteriales bacterium]
MRILHTSDWHLGRSFHRENLLGAQAAFVDHLVATVRAERVNVVVICGDVYDRALPPVDAVALCDESLRRIRDAGAAAVVISGNHDSARRLGFGSALFETAGVYLRTDADRVGEPVPLADRHGPVAVYGIPYLEPDVVRGPWALPERGHRAALGAAMDRIRADLTRWPAGTRSVVLSHAFVTGGDSPAGDESSDSERDISVGGAAHVPAGTYHGVDYVALGHLHGRRELGWTIRYSGSPLAYSFSEEHHRKGCWLVDLGPSGVDSVEFVPAPVPRRVARIRGRIDDLLTAPEWDAHAACWLQVTLTDPARPREAMDRLRTRFPHTLALGFEPDGGRPQDTRSWAARTRHRDATQIALDFVAEVRGEPADAEEAALLRAAIEQAGHAGRAEYAQRDGAAV